MRVYREALGLFANSDKWICFVIEEMNNKKLRSKAPKKHVRMCRMEQTRFSNEKCVSLTAAAQQSKKNKQTSPQRTRLEGRSKNGCWVRFGDDLALCLWTQFETCSWSSDS
jgi:hypothetical protein